uniref:Uncharacterized protein n=1 Tax=Sphaerodactylus townsendi TaxID=933632 RepID=A0ACB8FN74_9SAUR
MIEVCLSTLFGFRIHSQDAKEIADTYQACCLALENPYIAAGDRDEADRSYLSSIKTSINGCFLKPSRVIPQRAVLVHIVMSQVPFSPKHRSEPESLQRIQRNYHIGEPFYPVSSSLFKIEIIILTYLIGLLLGILREFV